MNLFYGSTRPHFFFFFLKNYDISAIFRPIFKRFSQFYTTRSMYYTRKKIFREIFLFPGRPGGFNLPHPVDRKQTFYLVLPGPSQHLHPCYLATPTFISMSLGHFNIYIHVTGTSQHLHPCHLATTTQCRVTGPH